MNKKLILLLFLTIISVMSFSAEIVTLKDGRKILIKDDFTWEEVTPLTESSEKDKTSTEGIETKAIMYKYPELLKKDIKGGVAVELISTSEDKNHYNLKFNIHNGGTSSVIRVRADIFLLDDSGNVLDKITTDIYKGNYRLANTYIRTGKSSEATTKIKKVEKWEGKVRLIINEIENR